MQYHTLQWFRNRIGKTIYRQPIMKQGGKKTKPVPCCDMCANPVVPVDDGTIITGNKFFHADYLYDCQNELRIEYQDKPITSNQQS